MARLNHPDLVSEFSEILGDLPGLDMDSFRRNVLNFLVGRLDGSGAAFHFADHVTDSICLDNALYTDTALDTYRSCYAQRYRWQDPFHLRPLHSFAVRRMSDYISVQDWRNTEIYNEFYKNLGVLFILGISLVVSGRSIGSISVCRARAQRDFTSRDVAVAFRLRPVLSAALATAIEFQRRKESAWLVEATLQAPELPGLMVVDWTWKIVLANDAGCRAVSAEASAPPWPDLPRALRTALVEKFGPFLAKGGPPPTGATVLLTSRDGVRLRVRVRPVSGYFAGKERNFLQLTVDDLREGSLSLDADRARVYRLTRRELVIAREVARGSTNARIAEELSLSLYTVQTHLQNIYRKVGAHTRTELLCRLS